MVYGLVYGVVHEREAAKDVAQEVFLKVYRQMKWFEERSKFKTWLYRIAMNAAIDYSRRKGRTEPLEYWDSENEEMRPKVQVRDESPGPREKASQSELRAKLDEAIAQLSPEHRAVLTLREWQGLSYEEIAESLGIESGTVMSRLFYARKKLADDHGRVAVDCRRLRDLSPDSPCTDNRP